MEAIFPQIIPRPPNPAKQTMPASPSPRFCSFLALFVLAIAIAISLLNINRSTLTKEDHNYPAALILPPPPPLVGPWTPNSILRLAVKRIGDGLILKPEDVVAFDDSEDEVFVSCEDGWIKRVNGSFGTVHNWTHIEGGRPLGLAAGLHHELIVCDSYLV